MDLERIIDELVYRKKKLDLDSPEYQLINRVRGFVDYYARLKEAEIARCRAKRALGKAREGSNENAGNRRNRGWTSVFNNGWGFRSL